MLLVVLLETRPRSISVRQHSLGGSRPTRLGPRFFLSLSFRVDLLRSTSMRLRLLLLARPLAPARIQPSTQHLSRFDHDGRLRHRRPTPALSARLLCPHLLLLHAIPVLDLLPVSYGPRAKQP